MRLFEAFSCELDGEAATFQACILEGYGYSISLAQSSLAIAAIALCVSTTLACLLFWLNRSYQKKQLKISLMQSITTEISTLASEGTSFWMSERPKLNQEYLGFEMRVEGIGRHHLEMIRSLTSSSTEKELCDQIAANIVDFDEALVAGGRSVEYRAKCPLSRNSDLVVLIDEKARKIRSDLIGWSKA